MTPSRPKGPSRDFRAEGLLCAIRTCSTTVSDLLARHPRASLLRSKAAEEDAKENHASLGELLWDELVTGERSHLGRGESYLEPGRGTPAQFWLRRRRLDEWGRRRDMGGLLPPPWRRVLEMPAHEARDFCANVGIEMLVGASRGQPSQKLVPWLGPLGGDLAMRVIEQLRLTAASPAPPDVAARWRDAYSRCSRHVQGPRIASALGRGLLAAMYRRLPQDQRETAARVSRSTLPTLLSEDEFLEPVAAEELTLGRELMARLLDESEAKPWAEGELR